MALRGKTTSGSCSAFNGANGLLTALLAFVTSGGDGGDWTVEYNRNARDDNELSPTEPFGSDCKEVILSNTGLSGSEKIYVGIREWYYLASGAYGWDLTGYLTYTADQFWNTGYSEHGRDLYDATWEHYTELPVLPLHDDTIYYWFYSDKQRIVVVAKVQSNYESCYLGFGDRFGNVTDYPYPLLIQGSIFGNRIYSDATSYHKFIAQHGSGETNKHQMAVLPDNTWCSSGVTLFPRTNWINTGNLVATPGIGQLLVSPVMGALVEENQTLWEQDQIIHVAGSGMQSEDLINGPDGQRYRVFQNIFRTTYYDYMGVVESDYTTTSTSTTTTTA